MERMQGTQQIGFLTFHHLVIKSFGSTFPTGQIPVQPSSIAPFPPVLGTAAGSVTDTASLREFSEDLEGWHNEAHMAVETSTGEDMMNPSTNILLRNFWRLHYFIDARFLEALAAFDGKDSVKKRISRLKKKYHSRLGEV